MSASNEPTNIGRIFSAISKDAWNALVIGEHERAQRLAHQLLAQPRLGKGLKARMHMILATGTDLAS
jgi:hypothetical protein